MELRIPNLPALCAGLVCMLASATTSADNATPFPGTHVIKTGHSYQAMVEKLPKAVANNKMGVVARASATLGAKKIGVTIPALLHHGKRRRHDDAHLSRPQQRLRPL
jgi:hypothetical protein